MLKHLDTKCHFANVGRQGGIFFHERSFYEQKETIKEVMKDAVLHETNKISFFGIKDVNPAFVSAVTVTAVLLVIAACIRI